MKIPKESDALIQFVAFQKNIARGLYPLRFLRTQSQQIYVFRYAKATDSQINMPGFATVFLRCLHKQLQSLRWMEKVFSSHAISEVTHYRSRFLVQHENWRKSFFHGVLISPLNWKHSYFN